jgi:LysR family cyn operon transcriptional activator
MELRQLKYFVRAAALLNFTKAADELFITQSTLSHQIKELETGLKTQLFDRIGKRVKLTEAGEIMLEYALKTIRISEEVRQSLQDLDNQKTGSITIGATYGMSELLIKSTTLFNKEYPGIDINVTFGSTTDLLRKIHDYEIDCMLSFLPVTGNDDFLDIAPLFSSRLSLIVHTSHPWSALKKISLQKASTIPLALPSPGYSIRTLLDEMLTEHKTAVNPKMETNDIHYLLELVTTKQWSTVLMDSSLFGYTQLKAIPLDTKKAIRNATIAFPKEVYRKKAITSFHEIIKELCR